MLLNVYVVVDENGDRPYVSTSEPKHLEVSDTIAIHHFVLNVPDKHKMANPPQLVIPCEKKDGDAGSA